MATSTIQFREIRQDYTSDSLAFDTLYHLDKKFSNCSLISFDVSKLGYGNSITISRHSMNNALFSNGTRIAPVAGQNSDVWIKISVDDDGYNFIIDSTKSTSTVLPNVHIVGIRS